MLHIDFTAEDTRLIATRDVLVQGKWHVTIADGPTGKMATSEWSDEELGAVIALAAGGSLPAETENSLYAIAGELFEYMPPELRFIP